jgi:lipid-A-disaccharide synthase
MNFLLSAGEASGDTYGAQLIEALRRLAPSPQDAQKQRAPGTPAPGSTFFGMGGEKMRASGAELLVHANEVAVVGLVEVVKHLPDIRRRFRHLVAEAATRKPDAAILIDFPDFNLRLARELHRQGIPVFYFVSPQIWAWRTGRVQQIKKYVRKMIVIFPFEQEFYSRHGVEVSYVGHPLAYEPPPQISRQEFAAQHGLDPKKQWIALLPGSRRKELSFNIERMLWAGEMLNEESGIYEFVLPVASTLNKDWLAIKLGNLWSSSIRLTLTHDARATLMHSRAAVVASGTATVEAALSGTPFVVVYRLALLTWLLGRRLVKLDTFAMPNLIAGRKIVPELIQKDFTVQNVLRELSAIIPGGPARQQMEADLKMVQQRLRDSEHTESPAHRAAREILGALAKV